MKEYIPRFSDKEYERRHQLVRNKMENLGIDLLLVPSSDNLVYLTNISMLFFNVYLLFPREGEPTLLTDPVIYRTKEGRTKGGPIVGRYWGAENSITIEASSVIKDMREFLHSNLPAEIAVWIKKRGYEKGTIGVVGREVEWAVAGMGLVGQTGPKGLKANFYQIFIDSLPNVTFIDATQILSEVRMLKSTEEIESVRKGTKIADLCGEAIGEEMKKPGVKEGDLFAAFWDTLYRSGGGNAWWFMAWTTPTSKPLDYGAHIYPYDYTLREGDIFIAELVPEWRDGYAGHLDVCFVLGEPAQPAAYEKMNQVCLDCYNAVVNCLKPGAAREEILEKGDKPIADAGFKRCAPLLYGIGLYGLELPMVGVTAEDPYWSEQTYLVPGMTLNVISHVYDQSTNVCVRTGSTHLITDTGNECLNHTSFPRGLVCIKR